MRSSYKACFCITCAKPFHSLGIARHRAKHREKEEDCKITFSDGRTYEYLYSIRKAHLDD